MRVHTCQYTYMYVLHAHTFISMNIHTYIHVHTYIYTHHMYVQFEVMHPCTNYDFGMHDVDNALGFFNSASKSIPIYLPGEMLLIKAEAYAMSDDLTNAVINLNLVRQKTDDIYGVNANLAAWTGDENSKPEILDELFKNRSNELFMSGMRFEDSRRIHPNLTIPTSGDYIIERNRNYYPYPFDERENNPNIPADPSI